jgi:hypothetical protein
MTYEEFMGWNYYFEKRPIGWRTDYAAYMIMQAQGVKEKPWKIFDSMKAIFNKHNPLTDSLAGSKVFHWLNLAKGGDKVEIWKQEDLE